MDLKGDLAEATERELDSIQWITLNRSDKESKLSRTQLKRRLMQSPYDAMVHVKAGQKLSYDRRCIKLFADYTINLKSNFNRSYHKSRSEFMTCQDKNLTRDLVLQNWVENNGALIKSMMAKGINELAVQFKTGLEGKKNK